MTFANGALQKIRMSDSILSYDEKCRFDLMFGKDVQQFRSEFSIRPVIEGHRDIRTATCTALKVSCAWDEDALTAETEASEFLFAIRESPAFCFAAD